MSPRSRSICTHYSTSATLYITWNGPIRNFFCLRFLFLESIYLESVPQQHCIVNTTPHLRRIRDKSYTTYSTSLRHIALNTRHGRTHFSFVTFRLRCGTAHWCASWHRYARFPRQKGVYGLICRLGIPLGGNCDFCSRASILYTSLY